MTARIETVITLSCDAPGCKNTLPGGYTVAAVREIAALLGWSQAGEADYCRAHTPLSRRSTYTASPTRVLAYTRHP